ncbi:tetratricopeptide repeat protein [Candidatus Obscuribacterales bacterium]|nr:tetratricopeptide repeat protein [Candidatus Obscuribacterales bacterium]MBX3149591.1 tetratricopeptide repeat protein [Candidatus Obscuribacterales bacterium]
MRSKKLFALLNIGLGLAVIPPAMAADNTSQPALPGVKFTKVQDLDPNKAGPNRPIRQKWAVCIGISKFKETRLVSNDPVEDSAAKAFSEYLTSPKGGRFDSKHVRTLTNSKATKQAILNSLGPQWLGSLARPDDLVVVFVSTNSFPTTDGSAYLGAYDCALDNIYGTCISMQDLMKTIKDNVKAERILLVVQASYSGATDLAGGGKAKPAKAGSGNSLVTGSGFIVMTSCEPDQMSWSNIFSTNLIAALKEKEGLVALGEAFEKTRTKTEQETAGKQFTAKQTPMLKTDWKGKDLIIGAKAVEEASDIPVNISDFLAAESYYFRANDLVTQGKVDEAIAQYQKAIETDPAYADALADLGAIYSLQKQPDKAAELYQRAIKEKPNDALFRTNYARVLAQLGRITESKSELERAYQLNPKDKVVLTALATYHLKDKDTAGAVKVINEAIALYPNSADLFDKLSFAQVQSGNIADAVQSAQKAVSLDPKSLSAKLNLGSTLMLSGDLNQATKAYLEATKLAPQDANAHFLLSKTLEKSGDLTGAKDELHLFLRCADPNDPRKKQVEEKLQHM